jgi:hypothetical protein
MGSRYEACPVRADRRRQVGESRSLTGTRSVVLQVSVSTWSWIVRAMTPMRHTDKRPRVQQRSTATDRPKPSREPPYKTSSCRIRPHATELRLADTEEVNIGGLPDRCGPEPGTADVLTSVFVLDLFQRTRTNAIGDLSCDEPRSS